jgi:hypothetical protein
MTIHLWIIRKFAHQFIITVITSLRWAKSPGKCHGSAQLGDFMEAQMHIIIAFIPAYDYVIFSHKYIYVCVCSDICSVPFCRGHLYVWTCTCMIGASTYVWYSLETPRLQDAKNMTLITILGLKFTLPWVHINSTWVKKNIELTGHHKSSKIMINHYTSW